jgi:hypothetical protein
VPVKAKEAVGSAALVWRELEGFDLKAAITLLDEEIREVVLGTASAALGEWGLVR